MGWGNRRKAKSAAAQTEATVRFLEWLGVSGANTNALSEATYFACMKILSESLGKLPLKLLQHTPDGGIRKCYEHPLYRIVGSCPNPYMTATTCWSTVEYNRNHRGNGYVWITGAGKQLRLWPLPTEHVTPYVDDRGMWGAKNAVWYVHQSKDGKSMRIPHDSMLHLRTAASFDGITGKAVRDILSDTITGNLTAQEMLNKSYKNGFSGKAVLQYTGEMSADKEAKLARHIDEYIKGSDLQRVIPMPFGTQLTVVNTKLAENDFLGLKKYSALQIAAAFGIKPNQINDYEKSSYASAEAQQLAFYVDTLLYILKQYEEELTLKLLSPEEVAEGYFFKFNVAAILRADQKTQVESLRNGVQGGIYTPNEARAFLDLPAKLGGDQLLVNGSMVSVTDAGAAYRGRG